MKKLFLLLAVLEWHIQCTWIKQYTVHSLGRGKSSDIAQHSIMYNMTLTPFLLSLHSTRMQMQSLQVDSVQRWMEDLRHMTEVECMCVLQAKPIGVEEDTQQGELIVTSGIGAGDHVARNNLQTLLRRALVVSTELGKMFQRLEKGRWQRVHSTAVRANCHVRSLIHEYSAARSTPPEMQKVIVDFGKK